MKTILVALLGLGMGHFASASTDALVYSKLNVSAKRVFRSRTTATYQKEIGRLTCTQLVSNDGDVLSTNCQLAGASQGADGDIFNSIADQGITLRRGEVQVKRKWVGGLSCDQTARRIQNGHWQTVATHCDIK